MAVYVDALFRTMPTPRWPYMMACHMTADTHEELMHMARRLRLSRAWLQNPGTRWEHFDLTRAKRNQAVLLGAVEESGRESAMRMYGK
jgi:hypothetical protein